MAERYSDWEPVPDLPALAHYVITTSRDFLEILAGDPPEAEWAAR